MPVSAFTGVARNRLQAILTALEEFESEPHTPWHIALRIRDEAHQLAALAFAEAKRLRAIEGRR